MPVCVKPGRKSRAHIDADAIDWSQNCLTMSVSVNSVAEFTVDGPGLYPSEYVSCLTGLPDSVVENTFVDANDIIRPCRLEQVVSCLTGLPDSVVENTLVDANDIIRPFR